MINREQLSEYVDDSVCELNRPGSLEVMQQREIRSLRVAILKDCSDELDTEEGLTPHAFEAVDSTYIL